MFKEFKEFITGGNVIEFAVAVIMAGAIGGVVKGFVNNIIMPIVGHFTGGTDFADKKLILDDFRCCWSCSNARKCNNVGKLDKHYY